MVDLFGQGEYLVRFDWGLTGARVLSPEVLVVVDVLSFSTSVTIAVERGMQVLPYRWNDDSAVLFAKQRGAVLAVWRLEAVKDGSSLPSLSPASLLTCDPVERLVLPSPNGSTIVHEAAADSEVVIGCLRNATAVAAHLEAAVHRGESVAVIAAGERWCDDDSLRPAVEDLLGAGAILSALAVRRGTDGFSPEAKLAAEAFAAVGDLADRLETCVSGRELSDKGFGADISVAAELDASTIVPVLHGDTILPYPQG